MGFLRHFYRLQKTAIDAKFICQHASPLPLGLVIGSPHSLHSLCNEISSKKQRCRDGCCQFRFNQLGSEMGFHKSTYHLDETKFYVEPATDENPPTTDSKKMISEDTDKVCRILSTQPNSSIGASLDEAGVKVSPELVVEVLKKLGNAGMLALAFFCWAEKQQGFRHTTESFRHLIEALGKIKQFRLIWSLVESMKRRGLLTKEIFMLIIRRYARARKIKEAINTFEKMRMFGLKPELSDYNSLIDTLSKSKHVKKAQEIFEDMKRRKRFSPNLKTYTILLEGWGLERDVSRLKAVYQEMIDEGFEPDVVTYGTLISTLCKSGKCNEAIKMFHEMEASNCKPSPYIYCMLINGLGSEKRLDEALKYFELSKESGFYPEIPTYNAVVGSYCWVMRFEDAFKVVNEMRGCGIGPNARTYEIILHHLIKAGKTEEAYQVFQSMGREAGCEPQLNTYTMIVNMFCNEERVDMALKVWKQMSEKGILPCMHMFSTLINGLCYENRLEDACWYFQEMLDKGIRPPGTLFSNLKEALLDGGKKHLALDLGLKMDRLRRTPLNV